MPISDITAQGEKKIWATPAWKHKIEQWAEEKGIDAKYLEHYKQADRDSLTFLDVDEKNQLLGIAICDKWVGHKGIENQLYIGLLLGESQKSCARLVDAVEQYALYKTWNGYAFHFVSATCLESQLSVFHDAGFRQGFSGGSCKGRKDHEKPIVPAGAGKGKGKGKAAKLYQVHKCVEDIRRD